MLKELFACKYCDIIASKWFEKNFITDLLEMLRILVFFGKNVSDVVGAFDMLDVDVFLLDRLTDGIVSELDVADSSGGLILCPLHARHIIIEDFDETFNEFAFEIQIT